VTLNSAFGTVQDVATKRHKKHIKEKPRQLMIWLFFYVLFVPFCGY